MFKFVVIISQMFTVFALARMDVQEFDATKIKSLLFETESGLIDIEKSKSADKVFVNVTKLNFEQMCQIKTELKGDQLIIKAIHQKKSWNQSCKANIGVQLPDSINVVIKHGSGDVKAEGTFKEFSAALGSGSIKVTGLQGSADFKIGSGNLDLIYSNQTPKGDLEIKSGSGDANVTLLKGTKFYTEFRAGSGKLKNSFKEDEKSDFKVSMKSGSGNLNIKSL